MLWYLERAEECLCVASPNQVHRKAIEVDAHLRVKGAPTGQVYAIGDASTVSRLFLYLRKKILNEYMQIETSVISHLLELVDRSDFDKNGKINYREWEQMGA